MATVARDPIYAALFALLQAVPGLQTVQRGYTTHQNAPAAACPWLCVVAGAEDGQWKGPALGAVWTLNAELLLYVHANNAAPQNPEVLASQLIDAIERQVQGTLPVGEQTLGGLVPHCRLAGKLERFPPIDSDYYIAVLPVEIRAVSPPA